MSHSPAVTLVAVLALLGSVLTLVVAALLGAGMYIMTLPDMGKTIGQQPPFLREIMFFMVAAIGAHGIWGILTAVGLFQRKRWARVSILLFSGVLIFFSVSSLLVTFLMPAFAPSNLPESFLRGMMIGLSAFYGVLLLVGVWWLVLFNRASIKAQFAGAGVVVLAPLPISITVIAWYLLSTFVFFPFLMLTSWPSTFFGFIVTGWAAKVSYLALGIAGAAGGWGFLKRKMWAYPLTVGFFGYGLLNAAVFYLLPNSEQKMQEFSRQMVPPGMNVEVPPTSIGFTVLVSLVFVGLPLYFLLTRRKRYLEACKTSSSIVTTTPQG